MTRFPQTTQEALQPAAKATLGPLAGLRRPLAGRKASPHPSGLPAWRRTSTPVKSGSQERAGRLLMAAPARPTPRRRGHLRRSHRRPPPPRNGASAPCGPSRRRPLRAALHRGGRAEDRPSGPRTDPQGQDRPSGPVPAPDNTDTDPGSDPGPRPVPLKPAGALRNTAAPWPPRPPRRGGHRGGFPHPGTPFFIFFAFLSLLPTEGCLLGGGRRARPAVWSSQRG